MEEKFLKTRYRHKDGKKWIEVRIKTAQQLFDARDPAPFRERDLDDDFVEYITSSFLEFPKYSLAKIVIYVEENESKDTSKEAIETAIRAFFSFQIDFQQSHLKAFFRRAQVFLLIGLAVLGICLSVSQAISENAGQIYQVLKEGLIIFGWVSIWKPIETLLFDWYPLFEKLQLYKRIQKSEIETLYGSINK